MNTFATHNEDPTIDTNGTSLRGYLKGVSYDQLVAAFGEPQFGGHKTDYEWDIQFPCGTVATVYNWKNGPNYCGDEGLTADKIRTWNVGGHKAEAPDLVRVAIDSAGVRYHIVEVGCSHAALPAEWLEECDLVRSDLTREEAVEWEGLHPDRIGSGATVLGPATPRELRAHIKVGDIGSLHMIVSLINDAHDEGYLREGALALLLGGVA